MYLHTHSFSIKKEYGQQLHAKARVPAASSVEVNDSMLPHQGQKWIGIF
jgi:hypothetical protein